MKNKFYKRLKELRLSEGLTQKDLANIFGVSHSTIHRWENNKSEPNLDKLVAISKYFNVKTAFLLN